MVCRLFDDCKYMDIYLRIPQEYCYLGKQKNSLYFLASMCEHLWPSPSHLINLSNWPINDIFTGIVRTFCAVYKAWMWRSQVVTSWFEKIQTVFLFSKIAVFLGYKEIYIHYLWSSNSLHSILVTVFCKKKMKQHGLKFHASGQRSIWVEPCSIVQPITHNLVHWKQYGSNHSTWYTLATSVGPHGMVQPITVAIT